MFDRFTKETRQCMDFARIEAILKSEGWVEVEHLLLGVIIVDMQKERRMFNELLPNIKHEDLIQKLRESLVEGVAHRDDYPLSREVKDIMAVIFDYAVQKHIQHIGYSYFLYGLLVCCKTTKAYKILLECGLNIEMFLKYVETRQDEMGWKY